MRSWCALIVRTTERGVDVRIAWAEPVSEAAADELGSCGRRRPLHHVVLAVEEVRGVQGIRRHWREAGEAVKDRRGPLPAITDEVFDAPGAGAGRIRADRYRIPVCESEITARLIGKRIPPRKTALLAFRRTERRAVILTLGWQSFAAPCRISGGLVVRHVDRRVER